MREENHVIPPENLNSQIYINEIKLWTQKQKMKINTNKSKLMIFNYTKTNQLNSSLKLNNEILETVHKTKLLGPIISNALKWEKNNSSLV